ncbi:MAG: hypothetical protein KBD78_05035 [Oligoflexales bacterium]|nr:hypothetical protein [Oligoflexales bacterium]
MQQNDNNSATFNANHKSDLVWLKLFYPARPWHLVFRLRARSLSLQHISAQLLAPELPDGVTMSEVSQLLDYESHFQLQLDDPRLEQESLLLTALLNKKENHGQILNLNFQIETCEGDLADLVNHIAQNDPMAASGRSEAYANAALLNKDSLWRSLNKL